MARLLCIFSRKKKYLLLPLEDSAYEWGTYVLYNEEGGEEDTECYDLNALGIPLGLIYTIPPSKLPYSLLRRSTYIQAQDSLSRKLRVTQVLSESPRVTLTHNIPRALNQHYDKRALEYPHGRGQSKSAPPVRPTKGYDGEGPEHKEKDKANSGIMNRRREENDPSGFHSNQVIRSQRTSLEANGDNFQKPYINSKEMQSLQTQGDHEVKYDVKQSWSSESYANRSSTILTQSTGNNRDLSRSFANGPVKSTIVISSDVNHNASTSYKDYDQWQKPLEMEGLVYVNDVEKRVQPTLGERRNFKGPSLRIKAPNQYDGVLHKPAPVLPKRDYPRSSQKQRDFSCLVPEMKERIYENINRHLPCTCNTDCERDLHPARNSFEPNDRRVPRFNEPPPYPGHSKQNHYKQWNIPDHNGINIGDHWQHVLNEVNPSRGQNVNYNERNYTPSAANILNTSPHVKNTFSPTMGSAKVTYLTEQELNSNQTSYTKPTDLIGRYKEPLIIEDVTETLSPRQENYRTNHSAFEPPQKSHYQDKWLPANHVSNTNGLNPVFAKPNGQDILFQDDDIEPEPLHNSSNHYGVVGTDSGLYIIGDQDSMNYNVQRAESQAKSQSQVPPSYTIGSIISPMMKELQISSYDNDPASFVSPRNYISTSEPSDDYPDSGYGLSPKRFYNGEIIVQRDWTVNETRSRSQSYKVTARSIHEPISRRDIPPDEYYYW